MRHPFHSNPPCHPPRRCIGIERRGRQNEAREESKMFFFEKKNQKTFALWGWGDAEAKPRVRGYPAAIPK
jgi:hypothetical protein